MQFHPRAVGGNEFAKTMLSDDAVFCIAHQAFKRLLGAGHVALRKAFDENFRVSHAPADEDADNQTASVGGRGLLEFALEVLHAVVEAINLLHRPEPAAIQARPGERAGKFSERGDDGHLRLPHLKAEQQQQEHKHAERADDEGDVISFHVLTG